MLTIAGCIRLTSEPLLMESAIPLPLGDASIAGVARAQERGDDHADVRAARGGDHEAFERLYVRYGRMVHGILLARVPHVQVDDLVQDVFMAAWQRLGTLRDEAAFGGWLGMIARNRATDYHRQAVETVEWTEPDTVSGGASGAPGAVEAPLDAQRALAAIRALPAAYRETLVLRLVEGMSGPEIAARTGLTAASVRVNLYRGMRLLRARLGLER